MKESGSQKLLPKQRLLSRLRTALETPRGILLRDCVILLVSGFLIAGASIAGLPLPLAACMVGALQPGLRAVFAAVGVCLGHILLWGGIHSAEAVCLCVLLLAAGVLFQGTHLPAGRWFHPVVAATVSAILGAVVLVASPKGLAFPLWLMKILLAAVSAAAFRSAVRGDERGKLFFLAVLVSGLSGLPLPLNLGLLCATSLMFLSAELATVAVLGIALDLTGGYVGSATAALLLPAVLCRALRIRSLGWRAAMCVTMPAAILLCFGTGGVAEYIAVPLGVGLGILLHKSDLHPIGVASGARENAAQALHEAAGVLQTLQQQLPAEEKLAVQNEADSVYDGAADRVCRCCPRFHRCWQHCAQQTYHALSSASRAIMERGIAVAEDFPRDFRENCCHLEGFLIAINQELDGMLYRRRYQMQLQECRQILSEEFGCVAEYLQHMQNELYAPEFGNTAFLPRFGISTIGKDGSGVVGDRGACFAGRHADYYVVLCDGMGTGSEAAAVSGSTVRLLRQLLSSGMDPESALRILNGTFLLRGTGCFATVDLLHIDLEHGDAELFKWGAAPSYLRTVDQVKKIGTAVPPPGVGVGGNHSPERYRLSLRRGEMLVLVSDGAGMEETEAAIEAFSGDSPRELAALLIAGMAAEDDMTAVAISLRSRMSCP